MLKVLFFVCFAVLFYVALAMPADPVDPKAALGAAQPPAAPDSAPSSPDMGLFEQFRKTMMKNIF